MKVDVVKKPQSEFEQLYLTVREKEARIYTDDQVSQLPYLKNGDPHYKEWKLRAKTLERFLHYLSERHSDSRLLEVGCGNGWFSNQCAKHVCSVDGIDVNMLELEQASKVFQQDNISFHYWDIFSISPFEYQFDCIVLNAVIQYFPDVNVVLKRMKELLNPNGEIHIIDSPLYSLRELAHAKKRTQDYYIGMNVPEMANYYFHHPNDSLNGFDVLYRPSGNRILSLLKGKDSPFNWYRLKP